MQEKINEALNWRAAVKSFNKDKKVPEQDLELILEAGRMAPTAYGLQPLKIVEVTSPELRLKLQEAAFGQTQVVDAPHLFVITALNDTDEGYIKKYVQNISETRGVSIESLEGYQNSMIGGIASRSLDQKKSWAGRQAYLALGFMLEAAALLGVDAGPMEGFTPSKVDEILGLGEKGLHSLAFMVLGYRENDKYSEMKKIRLSKSEFLIKM